MSNPLAADQILRVPLLPVLAAQGLAVRRKAQLLPEPIGPREALEPGRSASFTEHWYLAEHAFPTTSDEVDFFQLAQKAKKLFGQK